VCESECHILKHAINCDTELRLLSNEHPSEIWDSFQLMMDYLVEQTKFAKPEILFAWKQPHHQAEAKEPYTWRSALDELKNSDLTALCSGARGREDFVLMTDKPTMLKIGGEITNSLMHSYTSRHKITFN
jgi:hypothetical protein